MPTIQPWISFDFIGAGLIIATSVLVMFAFQNVYNCGLCPTASTAEWTFGRIISATITRSNSDRIYSHCWGQCCESHFFETTVLGSHLCVLGSALLTTVHGADDARLIGYLVVTGCGKEMVPSARSVMTTVIILPNTVCIQSASLVCTPTTMLPTWNSSSTCSGQEWFFS